MSNSPHLAIIECDSNRLHREGLALAPLLASWATLSGISHAVLTTNSLSELRASVRAAGTFDAAVIIAHGNDDGIAVGRDRLLDAPALARLLGPTGVERLAFVSCQFGRLSNATKLFDGIDSLDEVFASPVNVTKRQALIVAALLAALVDREIATDTVGVIRGIGALVTGGVLLRWERDSIEDTDEAILKDVVVSELAKPALDAIRRFFTGR